MKLIAEKIYFDSVTLGFFEQREFEAQDPEWNPPILVVDNPNYDPEDPESPKTIDQIDPNAVVPKVSIFTPKIVPDTYSVVTEAQRSAVLKGEKEGKIIFSGSDGFPLLEDPPELPLADLKTRKVSEVIAGADETLKLITSAYPESERLSWDKQEQEALAYQADNAASTPLLDAIISARGSDKSILAQKIVTNAAVYVSMAGAVFGKRQALNDQIEAATNSADLDLINW